MGIALKRNHVTDTLTGMHEVKFMLRVSPASISGWFVDSVITK